MKINVSGIKYVRSKYFFFFFYYNKRTVELLHFREINAHNVKGTIVDANCFNVVRRCFFFRINV